MSLISPDSAFNAMDGRGIPLKVLVFTMVYRAISPNTTKSPP